jgi:nucleoside-diphosphate-sugar epimerase
VVTTVRSQEKADQIRAAHPDTPSSQLSLPIVPDIAIPDAFDEVVKIPGLTAVIHTASPFHFNVTDVKKDLLDPAIIGTTGILSAIKRNAPGVKRVVITSSFASIVDASKGNYVGHTYSEADWNPITEKEATFSPTYGYRASKTLAEKAAWEFVEKEKPGFTISTINPPLVFGPVAHYLSSLQNLNTSNERVRNFMRGDYKTEIPDTGAYLWVDVRDVALAHVKAIEIEEAGGKRFFVVAGKFSNNELAQVLRKNFAEYEKELPGPEIKSGDFPEGGFYGYDNSRVKEVLGIKFKTFEESIVDTANSLKTIEA